MARRQVDVQISAPRGDGVAAPWVRRVVREALRAGPQDRALRAAFPHSDCQVGVVIADDDTVQRLNRRHRGLDETTDVLAFAFDHPGQYVGEGGVPASEGRNGPWVSPPGATMQLGEVVLCLPQAARQAGEQGHSLKREVALLLVHGVLHLLGYDHLRPSDQRTMKERQAEVLSRVLAWG